MTDDRDGKPALTPAGQRASEDRRERLAAALRENLRKRKVQQRSRRTSSEPSPRAADPRLDDQD